MFTGLVEDTGSVERVTGTASGERIVVTTDLDLHDTDIGDSIAVDGVCLTVTALEHGAGGQKTRVSFDAGPETLKVTAFRGVVRPGRRVHLERALRLGDRLGGHIVAGHVDGTGTLRERRPQGDTLYLSFTAPETVLELCIPKGSITIDGVSLTINGVDDGGFEVWLIPHTLTKTHLLDLRVGDLVNLESDVIGKYVKRLTAPHTGAATAGRIDESLLERAGFLGRR